MSFNLRPQRDDPFALAVPLGLGRGYPYLFFAAKGYRSMSDGEPHLFEGLQTAIKKLLPSIHGTIYIVKRETYD